MQDFIQSMKMSMELKGFAKSTQRTYLAHLNRYAAFCGKHPASTGYDDVRSFLHDAITVKKLSSSYVNSAYGSIKFYFQTVLCRDWNMLHIPRAKKRTSLPTVLIPDEVFKILDATSYLKHKAILSTIYSAGLRVSEATHLKLSDIHSDNMRIFIRQSKGNKDRYTILSQKNLLLLREYWKVFHPTSWLFPGISGEKPLSTRTVQEAFKKSLRSTGIAKDASVHTLRHCFATHLLNQGATLLQLKELLGHENIQTTSMYLHLTHAEVLGLKSPFDLGGDDVD